MANHCQAKYPTSVDEIFGRMMRTQHTHPRLQIIAGLLAVCVGSSSWAAKPDKGVKDPFERINRATYRFNDVLDRSFLRPLAEGYRDHVPEKIRNGLGNFIANIEYPSVAVNDALQGKFKAAGQDVGRFVVNTIAGVGGFGDPATKLGIPVHREDFGQTLGHWGVPAGPYLVLPLLGASDFRDAPSWIVDAHLVGEHRIKNQPLRWGISALSVFEIRVQALAAQGAIDSAFDPYALVRDAYLARRDYLVHDGVVSDEDSGYDVLDDGTTE